MKKSPTYIWVLMISLIAIALFGVITYYKTVILQDGREDSIRLTLQNEGKKLSFNSNYQSKIDDTLRCRRGDGFAGGAQGYYCLGGLNQTHGFYVNEAQTITIVTSELGEKGWGPNLNGSAETGYKMKGDERLTVSFDVETKESLQKLLVPDEFSSNYSQQITREEVESQLKIFAADPQLKTLVSIYIQAIPSEPQWIKQIPKDLR